MSTVPVRPISVFGTNQPFTSTVHEYRSLFNVWIVILTAIFFFMVLSWYNVGLVLYSRFVQDDVNDTEKKSLNREILTTVGYAIFWTLIGILIYYIFNRAQLLGQGDRSVEGEHPLVRSDAIDISQSTLADIAV